MMRHILAIMLAICGLILQANAGDYVLHVFGNANMDGTVDRQDIDQLKEIIKGATNSTMLADADYDGKVDEEDIAQVEKIIADSEESLTILDGNGRPVTVRLPVKRAIVEHLDNSEMMMIQKKIDEVIGVDLAMSKSEKEFPDLVKKTSVPGFSPVKDPDYELALSLNPDLLLTFSNNTAEKVAKMPGVPVVFAGLYYPDLINPENSSFTDAVHKLGYIMNARDEAEQYIGWHIEKINEIKSITMNRKASEKPGVLIASLPKEGDKSLFTYAKIDTLSQMISLAGGRSIAEDLPGYLKSSYRIEVDPEWAIEKNPEYIIFITIVLDPPIGYDSDDVRGISKALSEFKSRPEYANLTAVRNNHVYIINGNLRNDATKGLIGAAYLAKIFNSEGTTPDPEAMHQEYLKRFLGLDYDLNEHGVFVYPPLSGGEGMLEGIPDSYYPAEAANATAIK